MRITTRGGVSDKPHRYMSTSERFDVQHIPVPESGCWLWLGTEVKGYGQFRADGRSQLAHRYSLSRKLGRDIGEGMLACHSCDTALCVNPDHLYEGTRLDNAADAVIRGQQLRGDALRRAFKTRCHGTDHHSSRLTEADVIAIRDSVESIGGLSARYGICKQTVVKVLNGITWKHLIQPARN